MLCFLSAWHLHAQPSFILELEAEQTHRFIPQESKPFPDTISLQNFMTGLLQKLVEDHYLESKIVALNRKENLFQYQLYLGKKYHDFKIRLEGQNKTYSYPELLKLREDLLKEAEAEGYPFASVQFQQLAIENHQVTGELILQKNKAVDFKNIKIIGDCKLSPRFLSRYLNIRPGQAFNQNLLNDAQQKLRNLNYLSMTKEPKLRFNQEGADVYLFLEDRKASRFDLVFGILPGNTDVTAIQKTTLTVLGLIDLQNAFGKGEQLFLSFKQLKPQTQDLNFKGAYPYLLDSPFGIESSFDLYRLDSTYLDVNVEFGLQYLFNGNNYLEAFVRNEQTNLLSIDDGRILSTRRLPEFLDRNNRSFGLKWFYTQVDYIFNPTKGWFINGKASYGRKQIEPNGDIGQLVDEDDPTFDFGSLYDDVLLESDLFHTQLNVSYYWPLGKRSTIKTAIHGAALFNDAKILPNEQFRIGGNQLLRGFDEQSLYADQYAIATLEYRLLFSKNAFGAVFVDASWLENNAGDQKITQRPLGFGAGFSFETGAGIFGLNVALGRDLANPDDFIDLERPKIHLGYLSLF